MTTETLSPEQAKAYFEPYAIAAANRYHVDPDRYVALIGQESGWSPDVIYGLRKSSSGASGIAQFMPQTAASYGINPNNPLEALDAGARYLANALTRYGGDEVKAIASYNAGAGGVDSAIVQANSNGGNWTDYLPQETRKYIAAIFGGAPPASDNGDIGLLPHMSNPLGWADSLGDILNAIRDPQKRSHFLARAMLTFAGVGFVVIGLLIYVFGSHPEAVQAAAGMVAKAGVAGVVAA